jgi:hypothetical protein
MGDGSGLGWTLPIIPQGGTCVMYTLSIHDQANLEKTIPSPKVCVPWQQDEWQWFSLS